MTLWLLLVAAIALLLLWASLHDIVTRTLPNRLVAAIAVFSLMTSALAGALLPGMIAATIVLVFAILCWRRGWMGGGDAKLLGAVALGISPGAIPVLISSVAIAGGVLSLVYLVARQIVSAPRSARPNGQLARVLRIERWRIHRGCPLPYACAIAAGTLYVHL